MVVPHHTCDSPPEHADWDFAARSSHDVVELTGCPVSHPLLEELLATIKVRGNGEVSLRVGAATGQRSAWIVEGDVELLDVPPMSGSARTRRCTKSSMA